jgi:ribosomal protein S18 acetylase RimI-like enzyme
VDAAVRQWERRDFGVVVALWLEALAETDLHGMQLHADAARRLRAWLIERFRDRSGIGLVAAPGGEFGGFLLCRVGEWEAQPPIVRSEQVGLVDVVCVRKDFRGRGLATGLVEEALHRMAARGAVRIETTIEVDNPAASRLWARTGFHPSLQRIWRPAAGGP